jgi:hypothetical protein
MQGDGRRGKAMLMRIKAAPPEKGILSSPAVICFFRRLVKDVSQIADIKASM